LKCSIALADIVQMRKVTRRRRRRTRRRRMTRRTIMMDAMMQCKRIQIWVASVAPMSNLYNQRVT
jgi:hypothetical protein